MPSPPLPARVEGSDLKPKLETRPRSHLRPAQLWVDQLVAPDESDAQLSGHHTATCSNLRGGRGAAAAAAASSSSSTPSHCGREGGQQRQHTTAPDHSATGVNQTY